MRGGGKTIKTAIMRDKSGKPKHFKVCSNKGRVQKFKFKKPKISQMICILKKKSLKVCSNQQWAKNVPY